MSTHTYKKCPYCRKTYETYTTYTKADHNHEGSPFITCRSCGKTFIDKEIKEPALKPYTGKGYELWRCFFAGFMPFGMLFIFATLYLITEEEKTTWGYIISSVLILIYILFTTYVIKNRKKAQEMGRIEYLESVDRLKDPEYAQALKDAGFKVPEQYLVNNDLN